MAAPSARATSNAVAYVHGCAILQHRLHIVRLSFQCQIASDPAAVALVGVHHVATNRVT